VVVSPSCSPVRADRKAAPEPCCRSLPAIGYPMTRYRPHQMPTAPAATRYALLQPETWLAFLTVWAFAANEWLGPVFLGLSLLLWTIYCLQNPTFMFKSLSTTGIFAWLVPLLALLSILWSFDPLATGRAAIQLALTIALALMTANLVTPKRFITSVWVTMGIILFMSIIINNQYYDAMTGRTTMAGVFTNKNTLSSCSAIFALASAAICFSRGVSAPFRVVAFLGIGAGVVMCVLARSVAVIGAMMLALAALTVIVSAILVPRRMQSGYMSMALVVGLGMGTILLLSTLAFSDSISHWPYRCTGIIVRVGPRHGAAVLSRSGSA
jgi:hypothetical protein